MTVFASRQIALALGLFLSGQSAVLAQAEQVPAILAGHALLPADSIIAPPADAPSDMRLSGKYTTGKRVTEAGSVPGTSDGRPTGVGLPLNGLPLQGHSGIKKMDDGTYWILTDNGFGSKANSPDAMLYLNHYAVDFGKGTLTRLKTIFLHDPDKKVPFHIVNESSDQRYLTGGDFDPESFQFAGGALWIGDEFGPWLIKADLDGRIQAVFATRTEGEILSSPDNPWITLPGTPDGKLNFQVSRSKGFEGMALSQDGRRLYPLLEGALWDAASGQYENLDGKRYLRVLEFDIQQQAWTGRSWKYVLENNQNAIGDFNMINGSQGLVIERDNGEGTADRACAPGVAQDDCFSNVAKFKRIYRIQFGDDNVGQPVRKQAFIDLMKIQDPHHLARKPLNDGVLTFPFMTIENVDVVDDSHIIVGNDNNFPFSSSRLPNKADDNELILLEVKDLLRP
ncbi:esterase-like activity of phytase family protein [Affinibrenneria salicis]|uniref:Esterase-like activity of phytase family protein n=1 Tax=Affinibrenneria salicis TaxID=2590031 RepID=A0A5J5FWF9_9GAMM|nr:esterase-like activity of phytase family protein [Affinibrenneria salicis]KAA8998112.1 esterase-like activity of phytase family protein [Affinibrenneria salicis]